MALQFVAVRTVLQSMPCLPAGADMIVPGNAMNLSQSDVLRNRNSILSSIGGRRQLPGLGARKARHSCEGCARNRDGGRSATSARLSSTTTGGMMLTLLRTLALVGALAATPALAHTPNQPPHQSYKSGDFQLESGEVIKDFAISYVSHGKLNEKKSNAILMVTAISGNHHRLDFLIGPGKALDTDRYLIICTDAIGNGLTTSPSNSTAQPHMKFPKFLIRDMVTSQKKLMEQLGIDHVVAVIGPSMGGMQPRRGGA